MAKKAKPKIEHSYTKVVVGFVILVVLMALLVLYFSFSKTEILIRLKPKMLTTSQTFTARDPSAVQVTTGKAAAEETPSTPLSTNSEPLEAKFLEVTRSDQKSFQGDVTKAEKIPAKAHGTVTIVNNYSSLQPLVATTRLLSEKGVLFRTKETVRVPAGASVKVGVEADQPGIQGEIAPSRFIIVALWPGLQSKIYGESKEPMIEGMVEKRVISSETIRQAKAGLVAEVYQQALNQLSHEIEINYQNQAWVSEATIREVLKEEASVEAGSEAAAFDVKVEVRATTLLFDVEAIRQTMNEKLISQLPEHVELLNSATTNLTYKITDLKNISKTATLEVTAGSQGVPTLSSPIFNRKPVTNLDKQSIRAHFLEFEEVEDVQVTFRPFWVVRSPTLQDHIEIRLK